MIKLRTFIVFAYGAVALFLLILFLIVLLSGNKFTGKSINVGGVGIIIQSDATVVYIHSPLNVTYNFLAGSNYTLDLNVSSPNTISNWWFMLEDLRHSTIVNSSVSFIPNSTFNAVRWQNKLTVYGNSSGGEVGSDSVIFYIEVPPSAPIIGYIPNLIQTCEGISLLYAVNITNVDEEALTHTLSPIDPFYVDPTNTLPEGPFLTYIISTTLDKGDVGNHSQIITVDDGLFSDFRRFNISVIEINNDPISSNIGVQTIWRSGDNSTFYKEFEVNDLEDGASSGGGLSFNISFSTTSLFNISSLGIMNFTANNNTSLGNYPITVCATDQGIDNIHPNISICGENGLNKSTCRSFTLTVTDVNRYPEFVNRSPYNFSLEVDGQTSTTFEISKRDPDTTIPDSYWYFDDSPISYQTGSENDTLTYDFACGVSGMHKLRVEISDGLLNSSLEWNISVNHIPCPVPSDSGGGGGGAEGLSCIGNEVCGQWNLCQNLEESFKEDFVSRNDYAAFKINCSREGLNDSSCGFQIRSCFDINSCNVSLKEEVEAQFCPYIFEPSCTDEIKNCHDGSCEVLVDCGGPCEVCATCSDGKKNQGEKGVDCGGPCPITCPAKKRIVIGKEELKYLLYLLILALIILVIIAVINLTRLIRARKEAGEYKWYTLSGK